MYSQQDVKDISAQFKQRMALIAIPAIILLIGVVWSTIQRIQWLTIALFILFCFTLLFSWALFLSPLKKYRAFISGALDGQKRTMEGYFKAFVHEPAERDGITFIPLYINISGTKEEEDDRLFYFDANLPLPDWQPGEKLSITSQDRAVLAWQRL